MQLVTPNGQPRWLAEPDDWAAVKNQRAVRNVTQPIRFQGQWHDEESGLYYNHHRYYDPHQGRYISQDPIGLNGSTNLYGYVNNPTGMVDPLGLVAQVCAVPGPTMAACISAGQWPLGALGIGPPRLQYLPSLALQMILFKHALAHILALIQVQKK